MDARVVIVGSGIVGSSAAYHLVERGWTDILVLDRGEVVANPGSTSHAPGGVVALSHSKLLTQMAQYGARLYARLEPYRLDRAMVNRVGTLEAAVSERRMRDLVRLHGEAKSYHVDSRLLTPKEAVELLPFLDPAALVGALHVPDGEIVAPDHVNGALQRDAAAGGAARFVGGCEVTGIEVAGGRVRAVVTDQGRIGCEQVLLATNIWGPVLGDRIGVPLPLMAYEHQYVVSHPLAELAGFDRSAPEDEVVHPSMRELDSSLYFRQHWDAFGVGSYHHAPRPVDPRALGPSAIHPFTPDDFLGEAWGRAQRLFPMLGAADPASFPHRINGVFAFSVDGMPIMGETAVGGLWVAMASWLTHAGGVGKSIAEWMTSGDTEWDMRQVDIRRFHGFQATPTYVRTICDRSYAEVYEIVHPRQPLSSPRDVRLSPFDPRHRRLGAVFTVFAGIELPNWFEANAGLVDREPDRVPGRRGWAAEHWSPIQGAEHLATRREVGLFDLHGLSIIEVTGREAARFVDHLCSNRMDRPVGRVVYTTWLTPSGRVRRDLTVARLGVDRFWMFVGEGTRPRDLAWVEQVAEGWEVTVADVSDAWTALGVWGPGARRVLERVTTADLANEAFPYFTARWVDVGYAPVLAMRLSYAGELGWELHLPVDAALPTWDRLWEAGLAEGMVAAGMGAFDSLRLEKGYRGWGTDVHTEYDPYEAGLGWTVRFDKPDFVGAEAVRRISTRPPSRRLACLTLDGPDAVALGYEPILVGEECVGHVTSANYGYSVGSFIAYGYLPVHHAAEGTRLEVEYLGERFGATVAPDPLFDPKMERMKA